MTAQEKIYINNNILDQFNCNVQNIAIAMHKDLKYIDGCICYDYTNKQPILSLINSMYWNGTNTGKDFYNGISITNAYNFIYVNKDNFDEILRLIKSLHFWLNNLHIKNAGSNATFYEDKLYKYSKEYKKEI